MTHPECPFHKGAGDFSQPAEIPESPFTKGDFDSGLRELMTVEYS